MGSTWTPYGLLRWKRGVPVAKQLYDGLLALFGDPDRALSTEPGSLVDDLSFAAARMAAYVDAKMERAGDQQFGDTAYDLLSAQEQEHKIYPDPFATVRARQAALAARRLLPAGASRPAFEQALLTLLGDNYVGLHITTPTERVLWPANLGDQPMNLQLPTVTSKLAQLREEVALGMGAPLAVAYAPIDPLPVTGSVHSLAVGDVVVIEPEILGRAERLTVTAVGTKDFVDTGGTVVEADVPTFTATFANAHEPSSILTTDPFPVWTSTQREVVVMVKQVAAVTAATRDQIHDLLDRMTTGVTTWAVVQESATQNTAGPFTLDDPSLGLLDLNPLDMVTVP